MHSRPSSTSSSKRRWTSSSGKRTLCPCTHRERRRQQQDCPLLLRDSQVGHRRKKTRTESSRSCRLLWQCERGLDSLPDSCLYAPVEMALPSPGIVVLLSSEVCSARRVCTLGRPSRLPPCMYHSACKQPLNHIDPRPRCTSSMLGE